MTVCTANLWNMTSTPIGYIQAEVGNSIPKDIGSPGYAVVPHQAGGVVHVYCEAPGWSEDLYGPCGEASIQLNGQDVALNQLGTVYNHIQPYFHHSGCPVPGIYCYSFALEPERYQPTGTCNFSRIDNATLRFRLIDGR